MHLSDAVVRATAALTAHAPDDDEPVRFGSGFWFRRRPTEAPRLVTCQHVVAGCTRIEVQTGAQRTTVDASAVQPLPGVDLALLEVRLQPEAWLEAAWIASLDALGAIEPVVVLGHPLGMVDPSTGRPVARMGVTATDPKVPWRGRPEFLVDAPCYPGSSGSPVLRYAPEDAQPVSLLGVLIGGPALRDTARTGLLADWPRGDTFHLGTAVDARHLLSL